MKNFFVLTLSAFFILILSNELFAVMANPQPIEIKQPDGTNITIYVKGDEFYSWYEDKYGYTIIKNSQNNFWCYANKNEFGELELSENIVGKFNPLNLNIEKSVKDDNLFLKAKELRKSFDIKLKEKLSYNNNSLEEKKSAKQAPKAIGTKKNFVLLIQFNDLKFCDNPPFESSTEAEIIQEFNDLFNKTGYSKDGAVGSVKDYFKEISYGKLNYESVIAPRIITSTASYKDYGYNQDSSSLKVQRLIIESLKDIDTDVDFSQIWPDGVPEGFTVIHAGGGAESGNYDFIWSHKWNFWLEIVIHDGVRFTDYHVEPAGRGYYGSGGLVRIGVICHESLHFFGLPDLYDTTYMSEGLGRFCVMAAGEWNGSQGNRPAHPCAWAKNKLGWISFQTAVEGINGIRSSASDEEAFYKLTSSSFDAREYFLIENRQSVGFDIGLPGTKRGLLIYHIDERQSNNNDSSRYLVDIEEADGTSNWIQDHLARNINSGLDSDYFRADTVSVFNDSCISSPNSQSYNYQPSGIKISGISSSSSLMTFVYGKDAVVIDDLEKVVCYPNPARQGYINIINLPTNAKDFSVEIFTITSKLVRTFSANDTEITPDGFRKLKWDCKNDSGEDVAPGVYLVLAKNNSKKKTFKVAVIR